MRLVPQAVMLIVGLLPALRARPESLNLIQALLSAPFVAMGNPRPQGRPAAPYAPQANIQSLIVAIR